MELNTPWQTMYILQIPERCKQRYNEVIYSGSMRGYLSNNYQGNHVFARRGRTLFSHHLSDEGWFLGLIS
jgi:hypothetical protein